MRIVSAPDELAEASGLLLLESLPRLAAYTLGLAAAIDAGAERLLMRFGGSGSAGGGAGALLGFGATLVDERGARVSLGNAGLHQPALTDHGTALPPPGGALVLSDVDIPLFGSRGEVAVFGPQSRWSA